MLTWNATRFVLKHAVATAVVTAGTGAFAFASWVALFIWNGMMRGQLAPPAPFFTMLLGGIAAGAASSLLVLLPATALAESTRSRPGFGVWRQLQVAAFAVLTIGLVAGIVGGVGNLAPVTTSLATSMGAAVILLAPLFGYWWALQSTDWVLRNFVRTAAGVWPSRFGELARAQEQTVPRVRHLARFRVNEQFTVDTAAAPMLVLAGDVIDGDVRGGVRACAIVDDYREVSVRIHSVEYVDRSISNTRSSVGLLLPADELDLRLWKAIAREGAEIKIV